MYVTKDIYFCDETGEVLARIYNIGGGADAALLLLERTNSDN